MRVQSKMKALATAVALSVGVTLIPASAQAAPSVRYDGAIGSRDGYFRGQVSATGLKRGVYGTADVVSNGVKRGGGNITLSGSTRFPVNIPPPPPCGSTTVTFRAWHLDVNDRWYVSFSYPQAFSSLCNASSEPTGEFSWSAPTAVDKSGLTPSTQIHSDTVPQPLDAP